MKAVVLVGGTGTRLRPLTLTVPKQVLPIVEVPMIERVLAYLGHHGVDEAVLSLGYLHGAFQDLFPDGMAGNVSLSYAVEPEPLDTAGAIGFAARHAGITERFLVVNGDILTDLDIGAMVAFHQDRGAEATISLHKVSDPSAFGLVPVDERGKVAAFVEKPAPGAIGPSLINAGTYVLEPSVLDHIPAGGRVSIERQVFPLLAGAGVLYGFESAGYWTDTGTPLQYLDAQLDLLRGRRPGPPAPEARQGAGGVWTLGEADFDAGVHAPALVGDGASVAASAWVESSVIGAGCRIHAGARVVESVLLAGVEVGNGALVSRSILGRGAGVGEGAEVTGLSVIGDGFVVEPGARLDGARLPGAEAS
ncbi:MAG: sugar phosphate nucleotidyltransferase [Acidimicrobiales bacterium]